MSETMSETSQGWVPIYNESYVGSIISAIILALIIPTIEPIFGSAFALPPLEGCVFPLVLAAVGVIGSVIGVMFVKGNENTNPAAAMNAGTYLSSGIVIVGAFALSKIFLWQFQLRRRRRIRSFGRNGNRKNY